jgi:sugar phosphate isomerase/epimerase
MAHATHLPVIGAALPIAALAQYADWLKAQQRDLEIQDPFNPTVLDSDWQSLVAQARGILDGYTGRMGVHGPFMGLTLMPRDPKVRQVVNDRLRQALDFVQALGATHMVMHSPFDFFGGPLLPHSAEHGQAEQFELIHALLDPIVPIAQAANCTLVIENIYDTNSAPLFALIRSFNSDFVKLSIDTGHAFIRQQIGGPSPEAWVSQADTLLAHMHIQDTDGQIDRHWAPGAGNTDWHALFAAIAALPQQPRLLLELRDKEQIPAGAAWLQAQGLVI